MLTMGLGKVVWNTFAEFGAHTTIGGLCNAGLSSSRFRQVRHVFHLKNSKKLDHLPIQTFPYHCKTV